MTEMTQNPYEPPKADVNAPLVEAGPSGNLDDAMAGRYDFDIGDVMREAWALTRGIKASFWGAAIIVYALIFALAFIGGLLTAGSGILGVLWNIVFGAVMPIFIVGILKMGVRRAGGLSVTFATAFSCFDLVVPVAIAGLLSTLLTYLGILLLIIPGIYLSIAYCMTYPLIVDRRLTSWKAMETSRKAVTKRWFQFFGLLIVVGLLIAVSAIPLGIGLIWTAPWSVNVIGVVYRRTFGVAQTE